MVEINEEKLKIVPDEIKIKEMEDEAKKDEKFVQFQNHTRIKNDLF